MLSSNNHYKDTTIQQKVLPESALTQTIILRISNWKLKSLILKGEFVDYKGYDLRSLFKSNGSVFLENELNQKQN
ncbi:unnamed protein product [Paramecium octaurelia]|uniref:Uncharacterized protein n=1 Tax=Paramecium octaurelia TaxID=43137 RepID=A0A8S1UJD3_PAROT|nr:unnamed protein product [Paramecium octaurelia]